MPHPTNTWTCRCGAFTATFPAAKTLPLACHCTFCRRFVTDMVATETMDAAGGIRYLHITQDQIIITKGREHLGLVTYSSKGALRWYATCCNTPFCNTLRNWRLPYTTITAHWVRPEQTGPVGYAAFQKSAISTPMLTSQAPIATMAKVLARTCWGRIRGAYKNTPFFDVGGQPVAQPERRPGPPR